MNIKFYVMSYYELSVFKEEYQQRSQIVEFIHSISKSADFQSSAILVADIGHTMP